MFVLQFDIVAGSSRLPSFSRVMTLRPALALFLGANGIHHKECEYALSCVIVIDLITVT